jgi:hypothetical protein
MLAPQQKLIVYPSRLPWPAGPRGDFNRFLNNIRLQIENSCPDPTTFLLLLFSK